MFLSVVLVAFGWLVFYLWGDYMKLLILLEVVSLVFLFSVMTYLKMEYFSMMYFFVCLIFLVCESSIGFLLFILYVSMEGEIVKKMNLSQF